jgi:hypothetical protein
VVIVNQNDISFLKSRIEQTVLSHCKDGERIVGTVHFVSEEEQDVIYDLIASNQATRYEYSGDSAYRLAFEKIECVTLPES